MKYYSVSNSAEKEIGRTYPQLHCTTQIHAHALSSWEFPNFTPRLIFDLEKSAKLTDVLSTGSISADGFLVNSKVRDILGDFNLMKHQYYMASVSLPKTGETLPYYWLHFSQPELTKQINYENSTFYETEWTFRENLIKINSYEHYQELKSYDKKAKFGVNIDEIAVTEKFDKDLDVFIFLPFSKLYISARLKNALEENKVIGLVYEEAPEVKFLKKQPLTHVAVAQPLQKSNIL